MELPDLRDEVQAEVGGEHIILTDKPLHGNIGIVESRNHKFNLAVQQLLDVGLFGLVGTRCLNLLRQLVISLIYRLEKDLLILLQLEP